MKFGRLAEMITVASALFAMQLTTQAPTSGKELKQLRSAHKQASDYATKRLKQKQMFMLREEGKTWVSMLNEKDGFDSDGGWSPNTVAIVYLWTKNNRTNFIAVSKSSPSGDWFQLSELLYREDGTLSYARQEYSAFMPEEGVVTREVIFDKAGLRRDAKVVASDIRSKREYSGRKARALLEGEAQFGLSLEPYKVVQKLPFVTLIR